jgi:hypothetical protein
MDRESFEQAKKDLHDMYVNDETKHNLIQRLAEYIDRSLETRLSEWFTDDDTYRTFLISFAKHVLPHIDEAADLAHKELENTNE